MTNRVDEKIKKLFSETNLDYWDSWKKKIHNGKIYIWCRKNLALRIKKSVFNLKVVVSTAFVNL